MSDDLERSLPSTRGEGPSPAFVDSLRERIIAESPGAQRRDEPPLTNIEFLPLKEQRMSNLRMVIVGLAAAAIVVVAGFIATGTGADGDNQLIADKPDDSTSTTAAPTTSTTAATTTSTTAAVDRVTIEGTIDVDLVDGELIDGTGTGTFVVTEGAETLGCSSGTIEEVYFFQAQVTRVMTCTSGTRAGAFTIGANGQMDGSLSEWEIEAATGDFVGLSGSGPYDGRDVFLDEESFGNPIYVWVPQSEYSDSMTGSIDFE